MSIPFQVTHPFVQDFGSNIGRCLAAIESNPPNIVEAEKSWSQATKCLDALELCYVHPAKYWLMLMTLQGPDLELYRATRKPCYAKALIEHMSRADSIPERPPGQSDFDKMEQKEQKNRIRRMIHGLWITPSDEFLKHWDVEKLTEAILAAQHFIEAIPIDHPDSARWEAELSIMLRWRYCVNGMSEDLDGAEKSAKAAIQVLQFEDDADVQAAAWSSLVGARLLYYETRRTAGDIENGIIEEVLGNSDIAVLTCEAVHEASGQGRTGRSAAQLASAYRMRGIAKLAHYTTTGEEELLKGADEDITLARTTITEADPLHPEIVFNLASVRFEQHLREGDERRLDKAIALMRKAMRTGPSQAPWQTTALMNLSAMVAFRSERTGDSSDITQAIEHTKNAIERLPEGHHDEPLLISNLAKGLVARWGLDGDISDLTQAIEKHQKALILTPKHSLAYCDRLCGMGIVLFALYKQGRNRDHGLNASELMRRGLNQMPSNASKVRYLCIQAQILLGLSLAMESKDAKTVSEAIECLREVTKILPDGHPDLCEANWNEGIALETQYEIGVKEQNPQPKLLERALQIFLAAGRNVSGIAKTRVIAFQYALYLLHQRERWQDASDVANEVIALLPQLCRRSLGRTDQQRTLGHMSNLASSACSVSLKVGHVVRALQQLEFGRSLMLENSIDGQLQLQRLEEIDPELVKTYHTLRAIAAADSPRAATQAVQARLQAAREDAMRNLSLCEDQIRMKPGFESFLRLPTLEELQKVASQGPIVIVNITTIGADAIILKSNEPPIHLPLPKMAIERIEKATLAAAIIEGQSPRGIQGEQIVQAPDQLKHSWHIDTLTNLWHFCVHPILQRLDLLHSAPDKLERVWWIQSGQGGVGWPYHAAGVEGSTKGESSLDRIISSYTPSIRALRFSRGHTPSTALFGEGRKPSISLVTMPTTPQGENSLPSVHREDALIRAEVGSAAEVTSLRHPTAKDVIDCLTSSQIMHFACHGKSDDTDPSESHLMLQKDFETIDRLTVADVMTAKVHPGAWLAYLSACSTTRVNALNYAQENLHLATAFQAAGFPHIVGSLRPIPDDASAELAGFFYKYLRGWDGQVGDQNRAIADALRQATRKMKECYGQDTDKWALYVHSGA